MVEEVLRVSYLFLPLVGGAILHGLCMKFNRLAFLAKPIDRGSTLRGRRVFGENKTVRGFLVFSLGTATVFAMQAYLGLESAACRALETFDYRGVPSFLFGFTLGLAAMLSELPNSFLKRQLDVASGAPAPGVWLPLFYLIDQVDMLLGTWLLLALVTEVTLTRVLVSAAVVLLMHQVINFLGYYLGMRKTLR